MDQYILDKAAIWTKAPYDTETINRVNNLIDNDQDELFESFYKDLEFGTGGLRGIMGDGTNRMNIYTVGMATQGLSNYIVQQFPDTKKKVAIAHDSRNNSRLFAETVANVFSSNGIEVYLFEDLRPTPELSFAIRHFGCQSGVVLTASHNPKEYNGYKAYWNDGGQVLAPHDKNIINEVRAISSPSQVKFEGNPLLIKSIGSEIDELYLNKINKLTNPSLKREIKVVYTSIHGTGIVSVPQALKNAGYKNVTIVEEQKTPDGNFPTVKSPNPEEASALKMALDKAKEIDADVVLGTDPDTDRVGIAIKNDEGDFILLNGNQTGAILAESVLETRKKTKGFVGNEYTAKTIVTTELIREISEAYNVPNYDTLTGFKYMAELIRDNEPEKDFLYGAEESYGYMIGDFVRDKDAVSSCVMICDAISEANEKGYSAFNMLMNIYKKYGFYMEGLLAVVKKGKSGADQISAMMDGLRKNSPKTILGENVKRILDYSISKEFNSNGEENDLPFPSSNVLQFFTSSGLKITARPSGTEPKIKFYFSIKLKYDEQKGYNKLAEEAKNKFDQIISELKLI